MGQRSHGRGKAKRKIWGAFEKKGVREATDGEKPRGRFGERLKKTWVREATDGGKPRGRFGERLKKHGSEKQRTGESQEEDLGSV